MLPYFHLNPGNSHAIHAFGKFAEQAIEKARSQVAALVGAEDPFQIIFTSGATESNHLLLRSFGDRVVTSRVEHSSIRAEAARSHLEMFEQVGNDFKLRPIRADQVASLIAVNNETGTVLSPSAAPSLLQGRLHIDATQALGKLPLAPWDFQFLSGSAHKFYGPKGIGFLYAENPHELIPQAIGGGQEFGIRSGTLNVPGIVGMGAAAELALQDLEHNLEHAAILRQIVLQELSSVSDLRVNGGDNVSPYILSVSIRGLEAESILLELDSAGFAVSAGSACSSRDAGNNPVLEAIGLEPDWLRGTLRISFGKFNTREAAQALGSTLRQVTENVRALRR
jgi:cysteine desulfurase